MDALIILLVVAGGMVMVGYVGIKLGSTGKKTRRKRASVGASIGTNGPRVWIRR